MLLLLPGPVTTRPEIRAAMAQDLAPWDDDFRDFPRRLLSRVLRAAGGESGVHAALPLQGCGHFITEAALRSLMTPGQRILIPETGTYAQRMARLAREAGRDPVSLANDAKRPADPARIAEALARDPTISHIGVIQSETGSGVAHDVGAIGDVVRAARRA